ncbi:hypothetical protein L9G15_26375, partial [Shewanella sp. A3A]|nr:hypothetical protein [Shewanella ferrihydritica]
LLILSLYEDDRCTSGLKQLTRQGIVSSAPVQFSFIDDSFPELAVRNDEQPRSTEEERRLRISDLRCKEPAYLELVIAAGPA